jgi:hypothetical protein
MAGEKIPMILPKSLLPVVPKTTRGLQHYDQLHSKRLKLSWNGRIIIKSKNRFMKKYLLKQHKVKKQEKRKITQLLSQPILLKTTGKPFEWTNIQMDQVITV